MSNPHHIWSFSRIGGFNQVRIETGADLVHLNRLDQKLWVALACPTTGLEFDAKTLSLIDRDQDGRIRASELIAAIHWAAGLLKNPDVLMSDRPGLPLNAIDDSAPEGAALLNLAKQILAALGKPQGTEITLEDVSDTARIFEHSRFNGDGILQATAASDEFTQGVIQSIIEVFGSETDRSGKPGIREEKAGAFFAAVTDYCSWAARAEVEAGILRNRENHSAFLAYRAVDSKINDYFGRCRLAAFDPRATPALNRDEKDYTTLSTREIKSDAIEYADFPLTQIAPAQPLHLHRGINPAWTKRLAEFNSRVAVPLLGGPEAITEAAWQQVVDHFTPYAAWLAEKSLTGIESLGLARLREILTSSAKVQIQELFVMEKAEETVMAGLGALERLIRYQRDLRRLAGNFVNFEDLYSGKQPAIFQMGTLYLDERSCQLCISVLDPARHASMAPMAGTYLVYCDCTRKVSGEKMQIVAAFTNGDSENIMVGRNGVFYDRKGRDFDATVVKIIDNPIGLRQAFWSPYKKFVRFIEEQVAKRAATAEGSRTEKLSKAAEITAHLDDSKTSPPKKMDVGTVAALGVAFGAIGGFLTGIISMGGQIVQQGPLAIVGAIAGIILVISSPSLVLAYIKLRKRNLGPILDANGWAINTRARINIPFGTSLTQVPSLPTGSRINLNDPFAEKVNPWPKRLLLFLILYLTYVILNHMGYISEWTNGRIGTPNPNVESAHAPGGIKTISTPI